MKASVATAIAQEEYGGLEGGESHSSRFGDDREADDEEAEEEEEEEEVQRISDDD